MSGNNCQPPIDYGYCPRCFFYPINPVDQNNQNAHAFMEQIKQMQRNMPSNNFPYCTGLFISPFFGEMPLNSNNRQADAGNTAQKSKPGPKSRQSAHEETIYSPFPFPVKIKTEKDCEDVEQERRKTKLVHNRGRKTKEMKEKVTTSEKAKLKKVKKPRSKSIEGWYSRKYGKQIFNKCKIMISKLTKQQIADATNDFPLVTPPTSPAKPNVFPIQLWNFKNDIPLKPLTSVILNQGKPKSPIPTDEIYHLDPYLTSKQIEEEQQMQAELDLIIGPADVMIVDSDLGRGCLKTNDLSTKDGVEPSKINDTTDFDEIHASPNSGEVQEWMKMDESSDPLNLANLESNSEYSMIDKLTVSDDASNLAISDLLQASEVGESTPSIDPLNPANIETNSDDLMIIDYDISSHLTIRTQESVEIKHETFLSNLKNFDHEQKDTPSSSNASNVVNSDLMPELLNIIESRQTNKGTKLDNHNSKDLIFVDLTTSENDLKSTVPDSQPDPHSNLEVQSQLDLFLLEINDDDDDNVLPPVTSSQESALLREIDNVINDADETKIEIIEVTEDSNKVQKAKNFSNDPLVVDPLDIDKPQNKPSLPKKLKKADEPCLPKKLKKADKPSLLKKLKKADKPSFLKKLKKSDEPSLPKKLKKSDEPSLPKKLKKSVEPSLLKQSDKPSLLTKLKKSVKMIDK